MLMLLFGFLTLNNLRQHRRVIPGTIQGNQIVRRTDQHLLRMLIAQETFASRKPNSLNSTRPEMHPVVNVPQHHQRVNTKHSILTQEHP